MLLIWKRKFCDFRFAKRINSPNLTMLSMTGLENVTSYKTIQQREQIYEAQTKSA
jgi:hypothetical protein